VSIRAVVIEEIWEWSRGQDIKFRNSSKTSKISSAGNFINGFAHFILELLSSLLSSEHYTADMAMYLTSLFLLSAATNTQQTYWMQHHTNRSQASLPNRKTATTISSQKSTLQLLSPSMKSTRARQAITPLCTAIVPQVSSMTPLGKIAITPFEQYVSSMLPVGGLTAMAPRVTAMTPIEKRLTSISPVQEFAMVPRIHAMVPRVSGMTPRHLTSMTPLVDGIVPVTGDIQAPPGTHQCFSNTIRMRSLGS
jgi:hypothetical protein